MALDNDKLIRPPLALDQALLEEFARLRGLPSDIPAEQALAAQDRDEYQAASARARAAEQEWRIARIVSRNKPTAENQETCERLAQSKGDAIDRCLVPLYRSFHAAKRSALCLSGGGIRSATFSLGVLQRLADLGLIRNFDYLSTVSGGGYIGAWLSCLMQRRPDDALGQLSPDKQNKVEPDHPPVRHLREYSNYLHPDAGLLSADTWTLGATVIRNLLLNWMILVPALLAVLMVPQFFVELTDRRSIDGIALMLISAVLAGISVWYTATQLPGVHAFILERQLRDPNHPGPLNLGQTAFLRYWLAPLFTAAIASALAWRWLPDGSPAEHVLAWVAWGALFHVGGWLVAGTWKWPLLVFTFITGALGGAMTWQAFRWMDEASPEFYAVAAAPALLGLYGLLGVLLVGLATRATNDEDREWWARSGAWLMIASAAWLALAGISIYGPVVLASTGGWIRSGVAAAGGISGIATILLGRSAKSSAIKHGDAASKQPKWVGAALALAAPVFTVVLLSAIALGGTVLVDLLAPHLPRSYGRMLAAGLVLGAAALISYLFARVINVNKYSLHAMYRDRLIRAYLGASRESTDRKPNRFTGFDPSDNLDMFQLRCNKPMHVVNIALNLVGGSRLAWQQRKAESYTMTPWHVGSLRLGYRTTFVSNGRAEEYLRCGADGRPLPLPASVAEENLSLGTAVAISGAAASPNMGYQSSPVVTFLMTMFNARLGWWLGNPGEAGERSWYRPGPDNALKPLAAELFGLTDHNSEYVNLSDGGHFENLGLYEMVMRRCHYIVVVDASCDTSYCFEDLANAIRKINIDFGIPIDFDEPFPIAKWSGEPRAAARHFALGRIRYSAVDDGAEDGWILYMKPVLTGDEPRDLLHYATVDRRFPHQPTLTDQSYDESQFESYRKLGYHSAESIGIPVDASVASLFETAQPRREPADTVTPARLSASRTA